MKILLILLAMLYLSHPLAGQEKIETVSKVVKKTLEVSPSDALHVVGEKASLRITGWKNNYIQLTITFTARHSDKKIAQKELEFMMYSLSREKKVVELRNAFILPSSIDHIQSKLDVIIDIMVPAKNDLVLQNKYGDSDLKQLSGKITAHLEFGDMVITQINGTLHLRCDYSEIHASEISVSSFTCHDEKSRIFMDLSTGDYKFNSKHSDIDLTVNKIRSLFVTASRSNVTIRPDNLAEYNYSLTSKEGKIFTPPPYLTHIKNDGKQNSLFTSSKVAKQLIEVSTTYNTITIK